MTLVLISIQEALISTNTLSIITLFLKAQPTIRPDNNN